jgi:S1-C subfamily serine protease
MSVSLKVSLLPESRVVNYVQNWLGFTVNEIRQSLARKYRLATNQGVVVTSVTPNSVGGKIGIQSGDIIRQVNQVRIENEKDFRAAIVKAAGRDSILILVQRGRNGYYVTLEP